jgi:chromosome segregation ATPase
VALSKRGAQVLGKAINKLPTKGGVSDMSTVTVAHTTQQLALASAEEARQKRENAKKDVDRLRREGAALKGRFDPLAALVKQKQAERLKLHTRLLQLGNDISEFSQPLDPLTFPSDEDIAERERDLGELKVQQAETLAAHERVFTEESSARREAIPLQHRLVQIGFEMNNAIEAAEGREPGKPEKVSLSTVEDFLGHSDRRFD